MANASVNNVKALLATLRDTPVDNAGASEKVLGQIYTYLMGVTPTAADDRTHWYCQLADPTTVAAATFLLRLFAYGSAQVELWKKKFRACLNSCAECVRGLEEAKVSSKHT